MIGSSLSRSAVRFLVNPAAGRGRAARLLPRLRELAGAADSSVVVGRDPDHLRQEAGRAVDEGVSKLIVAGGDGTFHHAVQALAGSPCSLGLIPVGSGNDLAFSLEVPKAVESAVDRALEAPGRRIDVGSVGRRAFAVYAGVGFDGEVARLASQTRFLTGPVAYVWAVLRALATFVPPRLRVEYEGGLFEGEAMFAVLCNCPRLGGGMRLAPQAALDDGELDLVVVRKLGRIALLRVFPKVYRGAHLDHPAVLHVRTRTAQLTSDRACVAYADGEPVVEVGSEALEVAVNVGGLLVAG